MMKIKFLVLDVYGMGGTIRTVLNVANYLVNKDYDVEIISLLRHRKEPFFYIDNKIKIHVLEDLRVKRTKKDFRKSTAMWMSKQKSILIHPDDEAPQFFSLLTDVKLYRYLKSIDNKKTVLITTRPSFNLFATNIRLKNIITIGQEHLNPHVYPERLQKSIKKQYKKLDYLATLTDDDTRDYREILKNSKTKVVKLTNSLPDLNPVISELNEKTIIAAGRLVEQKGFDLLIKSFEEIVKEAPDWRIKIFGSGRDREELQNLINEKHLYNHIFLMGPTKEIEKELFHASIYALSSRYEGFGMVIIEAMKCGVPVVSFDCPRGPGEIISHEVDGLLIENGNIKEFSQGLLRLIRNEEERKKIGSTALINVEKYSINQIGKLWLEVIDEIKKQNSLRWYKNE